ncbi:alpha/beta hydrolase [Bradyrhizobium sp. dw_411]|uniref:alpha/beta hydrolase n=1 Tax=Bradyrhizobium sp. dw_411 TaxID=2720082 RepID=UPI001BCCEB20|nr:alpha/beta hydrolase [Bradyrhizobium sp. dw_411]
MPLDPLAKRFLAMTAAASPADRSRPSAQDRPQDRIQERRQALAKLMQFVRADVTVAAGIDGLLPGPAGDISYRLYAPANATDDLLPGFVFFHGGGMVAGSIETHDRVCAALAQTTGCRLISVDYRLAPEHKFPAAIEDAIAATRWVSEQATSLGIDAAKLVVGGDSAGATLGAVVCQHALQTNGPVIALQCLICPVLDFDEPSPSRQAFAENHLLDKATIDADLADYLSGGAELSDPRISPLRANDLAGLPAAIVHTAEFDPMRDEGNAYARKLMAAGVTVEHICHDGMIHNFHAMGAILPQGKLVLLQIGEQVRRMVG